MNDEQNAALHAIWQTAVDSAHGEWNMREEWNSVSYAMAHDGLSQSYQWLVGLSFSFFDSDDIRLASQLTQIIYLADCEAQRKED